MPEVMEENYEYLRRADHRARFKHGKLRINTWQNPTAELCFSISILGSNKFDWIVINLLIRFKKIWSYYYHHHHHHLYQYLLFLLFTTLLVWVISYCYPTAERMYWTQNWYQEVVVFLNEMKTLSTVSNISFLYEEWRSFWFYSIVQHV